MARLQEVDIALWRPCLSRWRQFGILSHHGRDPSTVQGRLKLGTPDQEDNCSVNILICPVYHIKIRSQALLYNRLQAICGLRYVPELSWLLVPVTALEMGPR